MSWLDAAPFWQRLLFGVAAGVVTWWSAQDIGAAVLGGLRVRLRQPAPIDAAVGYALLGSVVAIFALVHLIIGALAAIIAVQFAVRWYQKRRFPIRLRREYLGALGELGFLDKAAVGATVFAWATAAVAAALPASWWDPIAYHLPIVARALSAHAFAFDPGMIQTAFPLLGEAAALPAFVIGGTAGAAFATLGCGIVLALICGAWADAIASGSGRLATALVSCSALWLWLAPSFYVDIPFAMFAVAALALLALNDPHETDLGGWPIAAGLLAGAAAATKYPGLAVVALGLITIIATTKRGHRVRAGVDFAAAAVAVAGGWYTRTAMLTGDPLFPFLTAHAAGMAGDFAERYATMTRSWCGGGSSFADALSLPWRIMTDPRSFCGDPGYALDLGAVFFLASLTLFRRAWIAIAGCVALTAFWFYSSQQLRFLMPAVCLYAIAAAAGATGATGRLKAIAHGALLALCVVGVAVDWIPGPARDASNSIAPAYAYIGLAQSGDDYLSERLEFYDAARWLRDRGGGRSEPVAALDDVRDYYFGPLTAWLNPYYQYRWTIDWSAPSSERYRFLRKAGYRYLVVNANEAYTGRTPTGVQWSVLQSDIRSGALRPVNTHDDVTVYELTPGADK